MTNERFAILGVVDATSGRGILTTKWGKVEPMETAEIIPTLWMLARKYPTAHAINYCYEGNNFFVVYEGRLLGEEEFTNHTFDHAIAEHISI